MQINTDGKIGPHIKLRDVTKGSTKTIIIKKNYATPGHRVVSLIIEDSIITIPVKDLIDAAHCFGVYQDSLEQRLTDRMEDDPTFYKEILDEIRMLKMQVANR